MLCPCCHGPNSLRPHIVWFGEVPIGMDMIETAVSHCDLFISIDTSGEVYPAAGLRRIADAYGAHTVERNMEPSLAGHLFDETYYGKAGEVAPAYIDALISRL